MGTRLLSLFAAMLLVAACATNEPTIETKPPIGTGDTKTGTEVDSVVPGSKKEFVVTVGDRVFFDTDQSSLSAEARNSLDNQAAWLNQYTSYSVVVEGHADERGTREYNLALGERRANAVRSYLIANGVAANRITTISYGKERPEVVGSNPSAWAQNRRGVTVLR